MLRPVLNESIGEKFSPGLITVSMPLNIGISTTSAAECPITPVSSLPPATVPDSTASASVPLDKTTTSIASEKKAATGNDRKLAAARPSAASSAIQQKMIPSPRAKFSPKPPSGYSTSMPSSSGNSSAVSFGFTNRMVSTPLVVEQIRRDLKFMKRVRRKAHRRRCARNWSFPARRPARARTKVPEALFCAALNFTRSCSGWSRR